MFLLWSEITHFLLIFAVSAVVSAILVATKRWHLHRTSRDHDARAVQAVHVVPTPRVGGVAVVSVLAGAFVFLAPEPVREITTLLVVSLVPVFFAGLAEDMGFGVSPRGRLVAAALSSAVAISLLKVWLSRTGIPVIDDLIALAPAGVLFTIFATTGVCHAFNLVDGVNGLSGTVTSVVALGLAGLALQADDPALAIAALMVVPATLGFLVFNFPFGKIFMGDARSLFPWPCPVLDRRDHVVSCRWRDAMGHRSGLLLAAC